MRKLFMTTAVAATFAAQLVAAATNLASANNQGTSSAQLAFNMTQNPVYCCVYSSPNHQNLPTLNDPYAGSATPGARMTTQQRAQEQDRLNAIHGMSNQARANYYKSITLGY